jgi:hypothetical protein
MVLRGVQPRFCSPSAHLLRLRRRKTPRYYQQENTRSKEADLLFCSFDAFKQMSI